MTEGSQQTTEIDTLIQNCINVPPEDTIDRINILLDICIELNKRINDLTAVVAELNQ